MGGSQSGSQDSPNGNKVSPGYSVSGAVAELTRSKDVWKRDYATGDDQANH
jgi:hypothetical protein